MVAVLVRHPSGARVLVDELFVAESYNTVLEGLPGPAFFDEFLRERAARWPQHTLRVQPIAVPHRTPRFLVLAAARVHEEHEAARNVLFAWWTSDPFTMRVEELLAAGITRIPLSGPVDAIVPDSRHDYPMHTTRDGERAYLDFLAMSFFGVPRALRHMVTSDDWFQVPDDDRVDDSSILVRACFNNAPLTGRGPPDPGEMIDTYALVAWRAPAPGDTTLSSMLSDVCARFEWRVAMWPA